MPPGVVVASEWSWRLLLIGLAVAGALWLLGHLADVLIPFLIAVLLCGLLVPLSNFLQRHAVPRWLAVLVALLVAVVVVGVLAYLVTIGIRHELHALRLQLVNVIGETRGWLEGPPLNLSDKQIQNFITQLQSSFKNDSSSLVRGAVTLGSTLGHVITGALLVLFTTLFILIDGRGIWGWIVRIFPLRARAAIDGAGHAGWVTLQNFARVQVFVAAIDALGIGLGALFLGLPLVMPIAIVVFIGSFVPFVGAIVTGAIAVLIALIYKGVWFALIMLAVVVLVQEIEGHVLQPLVMGSAVKIHPLAVVLAVAAGSLLAGIVGALFAVPLVAVANVMVHYIAQGRWRRRRPGPD